MNPRPFNFYKTGFYMMWSTLTQWRWVKIGLFAIFLIWVKDGTVDSTVFLPLATTVVTCLAACSLLDVILMLLPAKAVAKLTRTRDEQEAWENLGAMEAKP